MTTEQKIDSKEEVGIAIDIPNNEEALIAEVKEEQTPIQAWNPKTQIGKDVKAGKIKDIDDILLSGKKILEPEIVDSLVSLEKDLLLVGQSKGKFGGGKRRAWRQTQKKTMEGNVLTFSSMAVVGDKNGHVGVGLGKSKETLPSREKAVRLAKLNIIKVNRGCGHFDCSCSEPHSIPYTVEGKCGSVVVKLIPAPQGTGLVIGDECKKILRLAGIRDVYSYTKGYGRSTINFASACIEALKKTGGL
jgi:small subunit ribosomal protein S5